MPGQRHALLGLGLAATLLVGCGATATSEPTTALSPAVTAAPASPVGTAAGASAGSPQASSSAAIHLVLPSNWQSVDMTEAALANLVSTLATSNPQLSATMNQLLTSGAYKNLSQFAIGYSGVNVIGNVNVTGPISAGGLDLDGIAPAIQGELKQVGAEDVTTSQVTLTAGNALLASYTLPVNTATGTVSMTGRLYVILNAGEALETTFTCVPPNVDPCLADVTTITTTLTVGP